MGVQSDNFTPVLPPMLGRYESSITSRESWVIFTAVATMEYTLRLMQGIVELKALPILARTRENH